MIMVKVIKIRTQILTISSISYGLKLNFLLLQESTLENLSKKNMKILQKLEKGPPPQGL